MKPCGSPLTIKLEHVRRCSHPGGSWPSSLPAAPYGHLQPCVGVVGEPRDTTHPPRSNPPPPHWIRQVPASRPARILDQAARLTSPSPYPDQRETEDDAFSGRQGYPSTPVVHTGTHAVRAPMACSMSRFCACSSATVAMQPGGGCDAVQCSSGVSFGFFACGYRSGLPRAPPDRATPMDVSTGLTPVPHTRR